METIKVTLDNLDEYLSAIFYEESERVRDILKSIVKVKLIPTLTEDDLMNMVKEIVPHEIIDISRVINILESINLDDCSQSTKIKNADIGILKNIINEKIKYINKNI